MGCIGIRLVVALASFRKRRILDWKNLCTVLGLCTANRGSPERRQQLFGVHGNRLRGVDSSLGENGSRGYAVALSSATPFRRKALEAGRQPLTRELLEYLPSLGNDCRNRATPQSTCEPTQLSGGLAIPRQVFDPLMWLGLFGRRLVLAIVPLPIQAVDGWHWLFSHVCCV